MGGPIARCVIDKFECPVAQTPTSKATLEAIGSSGQRVDIVSGAYNSGAYNASEPDSHAAAANGQQTGTLVQYNPYNDGIGL